MKSDGDLRQLIKHLIKRFESVIKMREEKLKGFEGGTVELIKGERK